MAIGWLAIAGAVAALSKLAYELFLERQVFPFDLQILWAVRRYASPRLTVLVEGVTAFGSVGVILPLGAVVSYALMLYGRRRYSAGVVAMTLGSLALNLILKDLFRRPRPIDLPPLILERGFSFPSGHSMVAMSFYGFLAFVVIRGTWSRTVKTVLVALLAIVVGAVGMSRLYLGVHYPTDVIGGFLAGGSWLVACILSLESGSR